MSKRCTDKEAYDKVLEQYRGGGCGCYQIDPSSRPNVMGFDVGEKKEDGRKERPVKLFLF